MGGKISKGVIGKGIMYVATEALGKALPFLALPVFANYMSPTEFGSVANFTVFFFMLSIFAGLSSEGFLSARFNKVRPEEINEVVSTVLYIGLLTAIPLLLLALTAAAFLAERLVLHEWHIIVGVLSAVAGYVIRVYLILVRFTERHLQFMLLQVGLISLNIGMSVMAVILYDNKLDARIIAFFAAYLLCAAFCAWRMRDIFNFRIPKYQLIEAVRFGIPLIPYQLTKWFRNGADRLIVTHFLGAAANGVYAYHYQMGSIPSYLGNGLNMYLTPMLFRQLKNGAYVDSIKFVSKFALIVLLGFIAYAAVLFVFSDRMFPVGFDMDDGLIFFILAGSIAHAVALLLNNYLFFWEKTRSLASVTVSVSIISVALSWFLTERMGTLGAAVGYLTGEMLILIALLFFVAREMGTKIVVQPIAAKENIEESS